jgi:nicotinamidase-related amidase
MLSVDQAVLMVIDVQGKLSQLMHDRDLLFRNLQILVQGARILEIPIIWLEQNPTGLGATIPEVANLLPEEKPISKMSFSAVRCPEALQRLRNTGRKQVLLAGIEAHVCIYLTAADLLAEGYQVEVVADAVSSRSAKNKEIGLHKITALGGEISCTETVLFELLQRAEGERFKRISKLLRGQ